LPELETLIIRHLILPLTMAAAITCAGEASAQGAFPAPLPSQAGSASDPAFPPVNGGGGGSAFPAHGAAPLAGGGGSVFDTGAQAPTQSGAPEACMKGFVPLREEAEKRGKMIKAASERHAPPDEACKLIANYGQAELKMIKYVESNSSKCGIPAQVADQLRNGHKNTESMQKRVCNVAQQAQARGPAGPSLSEVLGSSAALPEATTAKKGGSTFDTLNGNVLTR
jgi:hypothetical protein